VKRTWTIIGVANVARSLKWYQSLFGQREATPAHDDFAQVLDADGASTLVVHEGGYDALRRSYGSFGIGAAGRHIPVTPRVARISHESVRVGDDS
jgi:catechol 2,3-dioxygenase-like lactoylglutathione lyase family enzyme